MDIKVKDKFPANFKYLFNFIKGEEHKNYISMITPRSAGKSYTMGWLTILSLMNVEGDILVVRKNNNTLKTSVIQECLSVIEELELYQYFEYHKTEQWIKYKPLDRYIYFKGIDKDNIKGFKPSSKIFSMCWIEEVQQLKGVEEINVIINTFTKNIGYKYLYIETGNGSSIRSHWINKRIQDLKKREEYLIIKQSYKDIEYLLDKGTLENINIMKKYEYNTYLIEFEGQYGQSSSSVYKKFKYEEVVVNEIDVSNIAIAVIGVDYGDSDATTFTLSLIDNKFKKIQVAKHYYHKNGVSPGLKDVNDYCTDFFKFANDCYTKFGKRILVQIDSASLSFYKVLQRQQSILNVNYIALKKVNKKKSLSKKGNIESRIMLTNLLIGAKMLTINKSCTELIEAFENCEYGNIGERIDNGTFNIDSLDSFEYSFNEFMQELNNAVFLKGKNEY